MGGSGQRRPWRKRVVLLVPSNQVWQAQVVFDHQHREGLNQTKRKNSVGKELVQFLRILRLGHADVEGLQMPIHRQRKQHHVKQSSFDEREVKVVQTGPHVAHLGRTDHAVTSQRSTDWRERFQGLSVENFGHFGRFLVNALHQQEEVFGHGAENIGHFCTVNGLHGLRSTGVDVRTERGVDVRWGQVAHEQRHVRVGERKHVVTGEDSGQTVHVEVFQQHGQGN